MLPALALLALSCAAGVSILEVGVRVFMPQPEDPDWLMADARYGHRAKPHFHQAYRFPDSAYVMDVVTNALGFRDDEVAPYKEGQKTILFLGDSFTFGYGVQVGERFDKRLAALCAAQGRDFRFINAGVDGWGTLAMTQFAEDNFASLRPDIIVLTFCENDPSDDAFLLLHGVTYSRVPFWGKEFIRRHSQLYRFIRRRAWVAGHDPKAGLGQSLVGDIAKSAGLEAADATTIRADYWDRTLARLRSFHDAFLAFNPRGVLIIQTSAPTCADIREHLRKLDNGSSLRYCDLYDAVAPLNPDERRLPFDPHWSVKVHELSSAKLYEVVSQLEPPNTR